MEEKNPNSVSIVPIDSTGLVRVENSMHITNKIINELEERSIQGLYTSVKIGNQIWMTKNLDVDCYANGDLIPEVQNEKDWKELKTGAWCYYSNDPENGKIYGKLYNWYAVNDPRGLAPNGWRIPSDDDWSVLTDCLGGIYVAGTKMKSSFGWEVNEGSNESGFLGLPGGFRYSGGSFYDVGSLGAWWSSSQYCTDIAWYRTLFHYSDIVGIYNGNEYYGFSVRCLKVN